MEKTHIEGLQDDQADGVVFRSDDAVVVRQRFDQFCETVYGVMPWFRDEWVHIRRCAQTRQWPLGQSMQIDLVECRAADDNDREKRWYWAYNVSWLWASGQIGKSVNVRLVKTSLRATEQLQTLLRAGQDSIVSLAIETMCDWGDTSGNNRFEALSDMTALEAVTLHMGPTEMRWWVTCMRQYAPRTLRSLHCSWMYNLDNMRWDAALPGCITALTLRGYGMELSAGMANAIVRDCPMLTELGLHGEDHVSLKDDEHGQSYMLTRLSHVQKLDIRRVYNRAGWGVGMQDLRELSLTDVYSYNTEWFVGVASLPHLRTVRLCNFAHNNVGHVAEFANALYGSASLRILELDVTREVRESVMGTWFMKNALANGPLRTCKLVRFSLRSSVLDTRFARTFAPVEICDHYAKAMSRALHHAETLEELEIGWLDDVPEQLMHAIDSCKRLRKIEAPRMVLGDLDQWHQQHTRQTQQPKDSWAVVRLGIVSAQEKRVAETRRGGLSTFSYMPSRPLRLITEMLDIPLLEMVETYI